MYKVVAGDTFELISRKKFGTETEAARIASANPGVFEPLIPGTNITIPASPNTPRDKPSQAPASGPDDVSLLIDGQRFRFWNQIRISRSLDAMDTVDFSTPFEPDAERFREVFKPFSYKSAEIKVGGEPLFTGTIMAINPNITQNERVAQVGAYSTPGVLADCTPPASAYPLEFNGQTLSGIASTLCGPFGIDAIFNSDAGPAFDRVACKTGTKILSFLTTLAKQRGLLITSSERGQLVFYKPDADAIPVANLEQGKSPLLSVEPVFNPQEYYSHVTGIEPVTVGLKGAQFTSKNPRLTGVLRPFTFTVSDATEGDVKAAVDSKISRMFANIVTYSLRVSTWRDQAGDLWTPGSTLKLHAPGAMIYEPYDFTIRGVDFEADRASRTATLNLILPGSLSGTFSGGFPWDV